MLFLLKIAVKGQLLTKQVNLVACKGKGSSAGEVTARFLAEMFALVPIQNVILEIGNVWQFYLAFGNFLIKPLYNGPLHEIAYQLWFFLCTRKTGGVKMELIPKNKVNNLTGKGSFSGVSITHVCCQDGWSRAGHVTCRTLKKPMLRVNIQFAHSLDICLHGYACGPSRVFPQEKFSHMFCKETAASQCSVSSHGPGTWLCWRRGLHRWGSQPYSEFLFSNFRMKTPCLTNFSWLWQRMCSRNFETAVTTTPQSVKCVITNCNDLRLWTKIHLQFHWTLWHWKTWMICTRIRHWGQM